jgi:hypothetical protein
MLLAIQAPRATSEEQPTVVVRPPAKPKKTSWRCADWPIYTCGTVVDVTSHSITVNPGNDKPVVHYPAHTALASGGVMDDVDGGAAYRLMDIKVGDVVCVGAVKEANDVTYCIGIYLEKRPGGRLPPCFRTDSVLCPYHERRNALADLEEKNIPLPDNVRCFYFATDPEILKSDAILAARVKSPPDKIEKLDD